MTESSKNSAETIRKLASLLAAGVPAQQALKHLEPEISAMQPGVASRFESTWKLANRLGGSPTPGLQRLAEVIDQQSAQAAQVQIAYAAPKATARLIMGLPFAAILLGQLAGLKPWSAITGSILGFLAFLVGITLLVIGQIWVQRLLENSKPDIADPGAFLDSVAIGLSAGLSPQQSEAEARQAHVDDPPILAAENALAECTSLALVTGGSIRGLLLDSAQALRLAHQNQQAHAISKLQVRLMLPLGLLTLPAFVLLAVAPMAIGMLGSSG